MIGIVFYGICVIVLPICVFTMSGTLARCLLELKEANARIERKEARRQEIIANAKPPVVTITNG